MLLGSPPDMIHSVSLHRTRTPISRIEQGQTAKIPLIDLYYITSGFLFQVGKLRFNNEKILPFVKKNNIISISKINKKFADLKGDFMYKVKTENNIINAKAVVIAIVSLLVAYLFTREKPSDNKNKNRKKKKSIFKAFGKTYSFFSGIFDTVFLNAKKSDIKKKQSNDMKVEDAIIIDI